MAARNAPARPATLADLEALPSSVKGEIIRGVLYTHPRPRAGHQEVESLLVGDLKSPYGRGRGGPGGWWILPEPGIELPARPSFPPTWPDGRSSGCRRCRATRRSPSRP